jgi:hypothetical protein
VTTKRNVSRRGKTKPPYRAQDGDCFPVYLCTGGVSMFDFYGFLIGVVRAEVGLTVMLFEDSDDILLWPQHPPELVDRSL